MVRLGDFFNEISVGLPGYSKAMPYGHIPRGEELFTISGIMIPETGSIETCREKVQYSNIDFWPNIVKFLTKSI